MKKFRLFGFLLLLTLVSQGQVKQEQEFRVGKQQIPPSISTLLEPYLAEAKRVRYYKETDGTETSYEVKFKKGRLLYSVEFEKNGDLQDVEFIIKPKDIPEDSFAKMQEYLSSTYQTHRIKKIQQQYLNRNNVQETLKEAFQNLLKPYLNYECIVATKEKGTYTSYEITFNASGEFMTARKVVSPNYDHVLYN